MSAVARSPRASPEPVRSLWPPLEAECADQVVDVRSGEIETASALGLVPVVSCQRAPEQVLLKFAGRGLERLFRDVAARGGGLRKDVLRLDRQRARACRADRAADRMLELPNVARPFGRRARAARPARSSTLANDGGESRCREVLGHQLDVARPLGQRGHADRKDFEPIEQVFPEPPLGDGGAQVRVRGGNDAHVGCRRACRAEPVVLFGLQKLKQLRLSRQRKLAHVIEQQRSVIRRADLPFDGDCAVEWPDTAPKSSFDERLGERCAFSSTNGPLCGGCRVNDAHLCLAGTSRP